MHVFEKDAKIVGIGESCPCAGILRDPAEKLAAEGGELLQNLPHFQCILFIHFLRISLRSSAMLRFLHAVNILSCCENYLSSFSLE